MSHGVGVMSDADMATLGHATGHAFDRMWVQMMITHHQSAITIANIEHAGGQNPAVLTLAQSISTSQTAQSDQLRRLLT